MRTDLSLEQKYIKCQRDTLGEGSVSTCGSAFKLACPECKPFLRGMIQSGHHLVFSKPEGCNLRGKHEFPGRNRSRIRHVKIQLHGLQGLNALKQSGCDGRASRGPLEVLSVQRGWLLAWLVAEGRFGNWIKWKLLPSVFAKGLNPDELLQRTQWFQFCNTWVSQQRLL